MNGGRSRKRARPLRYKTKGSITPQRVKAYSVRNPAGVQRLLRWLAVPLACLAALLGACASPPPPIPSAPAYLSVAAVALVNEKGARFCGGVAVGPRLLLTASHCVSGALYGRVRYATRERWEQTSAGVYWAEVKRVDYGRDLAWLRAHGPAMAPAWVRAPRAYAPVSVVAPHAGWKQGRGVAGSGAALMTYSDEGFRLDHFAGRAFWTSTVSIQPGWSGSPLYDRDTGALYGIVVACDRVYFFSATGVAKERCRPDYSVFSPVTAADAP